MTRTIVIPNQPPLQPSPIKLVLPCNTTLNVLRWGDLDAAKPDCLLLHGLDNNARVWDALSAHLLAYFTVYAIDFRGHGDSDWSVRSTYTTDCLASDVEFVCEQLDLQGIFLVGHSLGGRVAANFSARFPERVCALVLADVGPMLDSFAMQKMRSDNAAAPKSFTCPQSYFHYLSDVYSLADERALRQFAHLSLRLVDGVYYNKTDPACREAILNTRDRQLSNQHSPYGRIWEQLPQIHQPTLLLRGAYSAILDKGCAAKMLERLPDGKLITIEMAGHAIMIDNPAQTVQSIGRFLLNNLPVDVRPVTSSHSVL